MILSYNVLYAAQLLLVSLNLHQSEDVGNGSYNIDCLEYKKNIYYVMLHLQIMFQ